MYIEFTLNGIKGAYSREKLHFYPKDNQEFEYLYTNDSNIQKIEDTLINFVVYGVEHTQKQIGNYTITKGYEL